MHPNRLLTVMLNAGIFCDEAFTASEVVMPHSVRANKTTTLEFDLQDLRAFFAEKSHEMLGDPEPGFQRKVDMEPLFAVQHGEATLTGIRVVVTDTLDERGVEFGNAGARVRALRPE